LRRLPAKCANKYALSILINSFAYSRLGVGIPGRCETAIHATRRFLENMPDHFVAVKIDFSNAFNCIRRDAELAAIADSVSAIYSFCLLDLDYHHTSSLNFGQHTIEPQEGVQQGDSWAPLLFSLVVHPPLLTRSDLVLGYLDDFTGHGNTLRCATILWPGNG